MSALHQGVQCGSRNHNRKKRQQEEASPRQKWTEEWAASDVVNRSLIVDPSIAPPGFDLRRRLWSTLNHFCIHPAPVAHLHKLRVSHIVNDCPDTKFPRGLSALHLADEEAIA